MSNDNYLREGVNEVRVNEMAIFANPTQKGLPWVVL